MNKFNKAFTCTLKLVKDKSFFKKNNLVCGFTLIELLIVIAIIGVLASIILASLNSAREKGRIAAVQSSSRQLLNEINLQVSNGTALGYFYGACPTTIGTANGSIIANQKILDILAEAKSKGNGNAYCYFNSTTDTYPRNVWWIGLNYPKTNQFWCIDSNNTSKVETGGISTYGTGITAGYLCL